MMADMTMTPELLLLIDTLRRSLTLIRECPSVRVQRAHAAAVDSVIEPVSQLGYLCGEIGMAAEGTIEAAPERLARWRGELEAIRGAFEGFIETLSRPDEMTGATQRGWSEDLERLGRVIFSLQSAQQEPDPTMRQEIKRVVDEELNVIFAGGRGPGATGFAQRCDLAVVDAECQRRMIPALVEYAEPGRPWPVDALAELLREVKPWLRRTGGAVLIPSSGNEIIAASDALRAGDRQTPARDVAYRLVGELYGVKWTTVRDELNKWAARRAEADAE